MDVVCENDCLFDKICCLVFDLFDVISLEDVVSIVEDSLCYEFQVFYVSLILFSDSSVLVGCLVSSVEVYQVIGGLFFGGKIVCGVLCLYELVFFFGESDCDEIGFVVVVFLSFQGLYGVFVIGSFDLQYYKSFFGILFFGYVVEVLVCVLLCFFLLLCLVC